MSKGKAPCIFCGLRRPLSKQHIFPKRVSKILGLQSMSHTLSFGFEVIDTSSHRSLERDTSRTVKQGDLASRKLRRVCKVCNSGWMSRAESTALDLLEPVILGETRSYDREMQQHIALFAAIVAVMLDISYRDTAILEAVDWRYIFAEQSSPENWCILLARGDYADIAFERGANMMVGHATEPDFVSSSSICILMGGLFMQVLIPTRRTDVIHFAPDLDMLAGERLMVVHPYQSTVHLQHAMVVKKSHLAYLAKYDGLKVVKRSS